MRRLILTAASLLVIVSCGSKRTTYSDLLADIPFVVAQLDSAVNAMYGWEPRDSTYDSSVDTLVADIMTRYDPESLAGQDANSVMPAIRKGAYDDARETWATFKSLCDQGKYEQALDFYLADKENGDGSNAGDFLVHLKHSTYRYQFFSDVLLPLMREFRGDTFAVDKYIDILYLEKAMEDASIAMHEGDADYIPEVYPIVVKDLGFALATSGKMEEALELSGDLIEAAYSITGSEIYANFIGTQYGSQLYEQKGDKKTAITIWEGLKQYLDEYKDDFNPKDLEVFLPRIDNEIESLSTK